MGERTGGYKLRLRRPGASVDWFAILTDLARRGIQTPGVAAATGIPKGTIQSWKQGFQPNHADGETIVALWMRVTQQERDKIPLFDPAR